MDKPDSGVASQIAQAAKFFEQERTGHVPEAVSVLMSEKTLVITLHGVLSPAEMALAKSPQGAVQLQEFHRQLFANASVPMRQEIKRLTGVDVREAVAELEPIAGPVVGVFSTGGTVVQVFLLADRVETEAWSEAEKT